MNQSGSSTPSNTSSLVMNCLMLRAVRVGGQMSCPRTLMLHLHTTRRCLASGKAAPSVSTIRGMTNSYQGTLIIRDALDCQLKPAGGSPGRVNGLECGLLLTNIYLVTRLPAWTSPQGFHPSIGRFSMATIHFLYYTADKCVWGLKVITPCIFITKGGLCHSPTGVAGPGMGWDINC